MANPNPPTDVSIEMISGYAKGLQDIAAQFEQLAERMKSQEIQSISTINYPSGLKGRKSIESFINAANSAFWATVSRDPDLALVRESRSKYLAQKKNEEDSDQAIESAEKAMKRRQPKR